MGLHITHVRILVLQKVQMGSLEASAPYQTACRFVARGSADGTGIQYGSIACTGPLTPVKMAVSPDMRR